MVVSAGTYWFGRLYDRQKKEEKIDRDLNEDAGGHYIYLGYKTTSNPRDAIAYLDFRKGKGNNVDSYKQGFYKENTYYLCPYVGSESFCKYKGDLNHNAGGDYLYLYYKKVGDSNDAPMYRLDVVGKNSSHKSKQDLNEGAGGSYLYLDYDRYYSTDTKTERVGTDPAYYPFSYVFGKKVAITWANAWLIGLKASDFYNQQVRALRKPDGSWRNWDDTEVNEFLARIRRPNLNEELKSAGFRGFGDSLVTKMEYREKFGGWEFWKEAFGNVINMGSKQNSYVDYILKADNNSISVREYIYFFLLYD